MALKGTVQEAPMEILNLNIHSKDRAASYEQLCNNNISLSAVCMLHFVI